MVYGIVTNVAAPPAMYDALHAEVVRRGGDTAGALILHLGRATATGFQVVEVWRSAQDFQRYTREIVMPAMVELFGPEAAAAPPDLEEFEVRGLVLGDDRVVV
ncbi:hypothetical protein [Cellulomonas aerilata]|uniref:ABM domain-containing protein n=1 Tax=Cellulomonas aerilata TaxID=515326 RepID=A0A512DBG1_9CELL|nr:hypothetical protein [Cellulomonas aerilata]GEO33803.1 hypothetical protein CAE01nite_15280 [Cellulomonas aerilata]